MVKIDKSCIQSVLGCLIKDPTLLNQTDKYNLSVDDFEDKNEKNIFIAIYGLYFGGARSINIIDIENYIFSNASSKILFEKSNGHMYLTDIEEMANLENFPYYYNKLKKYNVLRDYEKLGFDISEYYSDSVDQLINFDNKVDFEDIEIKDIINNFKRKFIRIEEKYNVNGDTEEQKMSDNLDELFESEACEDEIGLPVQGKIYNEVISGACLGAFTIRSAASGLGKSRLAVADACYLAFPLRYDWNKHSWIHVGNSQKVLFIMTEQSIMQIKRMVRSYISGINEDKFRYGDLNEEEQIVLKQTRKVLEKYGSNLVLFKLPEPTIETLKTVVRNNCIAYDIRYVFFDYIFINPALLREFKGVSLRNDEILLMVSNALKGLAQENNIAMFSSTQVNANADSSNNIRNESSLAGSRAVINKADNGCIMSRPTNEELDILKEVISCGIKPNIVSDVYKVRSGRWTQVRIWSYIDLGTLRREDLFVTDSQLNVIDNFHIHTVNFELDSAISDFIKEINDD